MVPALKCGGTATIAFQANYALRAVAPFGRDRRGGCPTASCTHYVRLQAVTIISPCGREMPPSAAMV